VSRWQWPIRCQPVYVVLLAARCGGRGAGVNLSLKRRRELEGRASGAQRSGILRKSS
jgi:hypothetical protein